MPTFSTTMYTAQATSAGASANSGANFPRARDAFGKMRVVDVNYVMAGTEATGDFLQVTLLKQDDKVLVPHCKCTGEALGSAVTVSFGDASNNTRYSGTLTLTAIHDLFWSSAPGTDTYVGTKVNIPIPPVPATDQSILLMKFVGVTTPTAGKKLRIQVAVQAE